MNALIRLWNIVGALADSLTRTKELIDLGNARMEQSLGIGEPALRIEGPPGDEAPEAAGRRRKASA